MPAPAVKNGGGDSIISWIPPQAAKTPISVHPDSRLKQPARVLLRGMLRGGFDYAKGDQAPDGALLPAISAAGFASVCARYGNCQFVTT